MSSSEPAAKTGQAHVGSERKGARTGRRILEAARGILADVGYERATIRTIAATAGVDNKSSVIQHFGTKEALFRAAVCWEIPVVARTADYPTETVGKLVSGMLAAWAADPNSPMAVLLRTSMTSEDAAQLLRSHITAQSVDPMAASINAPDARLRAALAGAMLMGIVSQRYILKVPELEDAEVDDILRLVTPLIQALLDPQTKA